MNVTFVPLVTDNNFSLRTRSIHVRVSGIPKQQASDPQPMYQDVALDDVNAGTTCDLSDSRGYQVAPSADNEENFIATSVPL